MSKNATSNVLQPPGQSSPWATLTWDELEAWAGSRSMERGKTYANAGRVNKLAITADQSLLASVRGTKRYKVQVAPPSGGSLEESSCSCPVGYRCKHAVATIVAYLDALAGGMPVPTATPDDRRLQAVAAAREDADDHWDGAEYDETAEDDEGEGDEPGNRSNARQPKVATRSARSQRGPQPLRAIVESRDHEQLVELVLELAERQPDLAKRLQDESLLASGDAEDLLEAARRDIRTLTAQQSWWHHWDRRGHLPSFAPLREKFEHLLEAGLANHLLELGVELLQRGIRQVERSDDEGHIAGEIRTCLKLVFEALPQSGLRGAEKLLFAVYAVLVDSYELCEGAETILDADWPAADWSDVADALVERMGRSAGRADVDTYNYRHRRLVDIAVQALQSAGRAEEALPLAEQEARTRGDYDRVIAWHFERNDLVAAETWLRTALSGVDPSKAGLVHTWRKRLCEIAARRGDWLAVAAHAAEDFFDRPSVATFRELSQAADKAGCAKAVQAGAIEFLATGRRPTTAGEPKAASKSAWPLVRPDYFQLRPPPADKKKRLAPLPQRADQPRPDVLLELAIAEKRPDDALALYDRHFTHSERASSSRQNFHQFSSNFAPRVAAFVAPTHPERAAALYESLVLARVNHAGEDSYRQAVAYLKALRPIADALGTPERFAALVDRIRLEQRRKPKLIEMLDRLNQRPIVEQRRRAANHPVWRPATSH